MLCATRFCELGRVAAVDVGLDRRPKELERLLNRLEAFMEAANRAQTEPLDLVRLLVREQEHAGQPMPPDGQVPQKCTGRVHLDTHGAAERLNLSPQPMEQWRARGGGPPFIKIGAGVRMIPPSLRHV